jgi:hypothetical protein
VKPGFWEKFFDCVNGCIHLSSQRRSRPSSENTGVSLHVERRLVCRHPVPALSHMGLGDTVLPALLPARSLAQMHRSTPRPPLNRSTAGTLPKQQPIPRTVHSFSTGDSRHAVVAYTRQGTKFPGPHPACLVCREVVRVLGTSSDSIVRSRTFPPFPAGPPPLSPAVCRSEGSCGKTPPREGCATDAPMKGQEAFPQARRAARDASGW